VTSLGLVQMTRKRVGSGLLAAFSVPCEHCNGRGILVSTDLTELPHSHGRNGNQGGTPKPGASRSRSARSKAIAQVAAKTMEPEAAAEGGAAAEKPAKKAGSGAGKAKAAGKVESAVASDGGAPADEPASSDGAQVGSDGEAAGSKAQPAARRRPRRSAHRDAGPPDSVRAAQDAAAADDSAEAATADSGAHADTAPSRDGQGPAEAPGVESAVPAKPDSKNGSVTDSTDAPVPAGTEAEADQSEARQSAPSE